MHPNLGHVTNAVVFIKGIVKHVSNFLFLAVLQTAIRKVGATEKESSNYRRMLYDN